jgi:tRNA G18 (ribose-2'-O)-methylase SpoU
MRGYFAIGVEGLSKALNAANLFRTAHAFGARFVFTVGATLTAREAMLDTSRTIESVPYYAWQSVDDMQLPKGCKLVGVELLDGAAELPSFHHPRAAAYVLGAEPARLPGALRRAAVPARRRCYPPRAPRLRPPHHAAQGLAFRESRAGGRFPLEIATLAA